MVDAVCVRTNNPPCGAMRGFGAVQVCFAHEAQMDRLAARLGLDPVELRLRNALGPGDVLPTGQSITGTAPVAECIRAAAAHPLPPPAGDGLLERPGGAGRTDDPARTRRGVGFAVGYKNLLYSEGFDDTSEARVRLDGGVATVACAVAEVGQGFVTIATQIARTVLGCDAVVLEPAGTVTAGSAGSSSASRQTWMSGGAVERACRLVADQVRSALARRLDVAPESLSLTGDGRLVGPGVDVGVAEAAGSEPYEATALHRHRPTTPLDDQGQGTPDVSFVFAAHRAVVDVDPDLGLVRVVQIATGQDVGRVLHPDAGHGPDRGRHRPGRGTGGDGGDRGGRRPGPEPELHRLPHPDGGGRPRGAGHLHRAARARRPVRGQGGGRAADDLVDRGGGGGHPGGDGGRRDPGAGATVGSRMTDETDDREILGWAEFGVATRALAQAVADDGYRADVVVAVARGGLTVAGALAYALGVKNCGAMNVEFYTGVDQRLDVPVVLPPTLDLVDVAGLRVLVADDVADTGHTLRLVREVLAQHVAEARTAVLYRKPRSVVAPDYAWKETERWIDFPWSAEPPVIGVSHA